MAAHGSIDFEEAGFEGEHVNRLAQLGFSSDQCRRVLLLGQELATDRRYRGSDWQRVEPEAKSIWERRLPGTWDKVREAAHHAFDAARATA